MKRWKSIIALLLALAYLPVAGNCLFEMAGLLSSDGDCCELTTTTTTENSQPDPCPPYGCCPIEYAVYFQLSPTHAVTAAPVAEIPVCLTEPVLLPQPAQVSSVRPDASPPELPKLWQFTSRAALPPRAPSFVS